jgi:Predicted signal transduction protein with a C-terminal ATPase domain
MRVKKIISYFLRHQWYILSLSFVFFCISILGITQGYLKNEYIHHLKEETYNTEQAILSSVNVNTGGLLNDFIKIGCEIAINNTLYQQVQCYVEEEDKIEINKNVLSNTLVDYVHFSQWIVAIAVVGPDGIVHQYDRQNAFGNNLWNEQNEIFALELYDEILNQIKGKQMPQYRSITNSIAYGDVKSLEPVYIGFPLKGSSALNTVNHIIILTLNTDFLKQSLDSVYQSKEGVAKGYITDEKGIIVFHEERKYIGMKQEEYLSAKQLTNISESVGKMGWNINVAIDEGMLLNDVNEIYYRGSRNYIFALGLMVVLFAFLGRRMIQPVKKIISAMEQAKKGNLETTIQIKGQHEIWQIAEEYNIMIDSINQMNKQIKEQHNEKVLALTKQRNAEREALESQINAHFICNTLGAINYEAIEAGNHMVSKQIKKLSNILRYTFDQRHQNVYLYQEITWLEQYLYLQKLRYGDMFEYRIECPAELGSWACRKLMLQPFVENSIIHGFEGMEIGGRIDIIVTKEREYLKIQIADNGAGMNESTLAEVQKSIKKPLEGSVTSEWGIGISNVAARMKLYYGVDFEIEVDAKLGVGTTFVFYLPKLKKS